MDTVANILTNGRYDLRDADATQYNDVELLTYLNRALVQLDGALSALKSDWVIAEDIDTTLSAAANSVDTPARCVRVREVWIGSNQLQKKLPEQIYHTRKFITATGQPYCFAHKATEIIFEQTANADYDLVIYYDQKSSALTLDGNMPYGDEFNESLRQGMVLIAKNRQEYDVSGDAALFDFFMRSANSKIIGRRTRRKHYRLGF